MRTAWNTARILWASVGVVALAAGAAGAYLSMRPATQPATALSAARVQDGSVFRIHDAPRALPELAFRDAEGGKLTLAQFQDKMVLLNIWATWCAPCREEMPALDRLQRNLGGPDFEVVALSIDSAGASVVKRFYEEVGVRSLAIYIDPTMRATATLAAIGVPTTLLIDRQGRELGRRTGPAEWDGPQSVAIIEEYLKDRKP